MPLISNERPDTSMVANKCQHPASTAETACPKGERKCAGSETNPSINVEMVAWVDSYYSMTNIFPQVTFRHKGTHVQT